MKLNVLNLNGEKTGSVELPRQFEEAKEPVIIKRAVEVLQAGRRQSYGAYPEAGTGFSVQLSKRRRKYRGSYGIGMSRVPRKIMSRRGTRFNWVAAFAPGTRGGRRAHPPKAGKIWEKKINKKENRLAIRSALSYTVDKAAVKARGHIIPESYPFIIDDKFESLDKTKKAREALEKIGLKDELRRALRKSVRAGRGKMRGRRYNKKKSALLVISGECKLEKAARNIPGIDIVKVTELNAELLAPGAVPGRATLFTKKAVEKLEKEKLFM